MKKVFRLFIAFVSISISALAQPSTPVKLNTTTGTLYGTLLMPAVVPAKLSVVLIIAGSGPTDRDGNNANMSNNSLKMLAEALAAKGIASLRYDKRAIGESRDAALVESDLRFETYIDDATGWIKLLKDDTRFAKVVVLGHSEGSLIGMIAALNGKADAFISVAGAGQPIDKVLREQMKAQPATVATEAGKMLDTLLRGDTLKYVPAAYYSLFRPSVQPYMISWMKYDPQKEIKRLHVPILIVQGTTDIQVTVGDAQRLHSANPASKLALVSGMNHIFKLADADRLKNIATYSKPDLPISPEFANDVTGFVFGLK